MVCMIRNIQLSSLVPGSHCSMRLSARSHADWIKSSASARERVRPRAKRLKRGSISLRRRRNSLSASGFTASP
jgi:hypothetical protein